MVAVQSDVSVPAERVVVFHNDDDGVAQPGSFSCCAQGAQLYNRRELPLYELVEVTLEIPNLEGAPRRVTCIGVVVNCCYEAGRELFCIHVQFLDMPEEACRCLRGGIPGRGV